MRFALSIVLLSVCLVGDLIEDSKDALWMVTLVFLLNVASLPLAYQAFVSESYRGVARRLRRTSPSRPEEVEERAERARGGDPRGRPQEVEEILGRAFDGKLSDESWTYFTGTLLALEASGRPRCTPRRCCSGTWSRARPREAGGRGRCHRRRRRRAVRGYRRRSARRDTDGRVPEPDRGLRAAPARAAARAAPRSPSCASTPRC